ncbi:hypothetical protein FACS189483_09960 [Spirochaetia bacterium]|nr:hypothetical protein FACS189483_09960 [Spirochaetia bacterium]
MNLPRLLARGLPTLLLGGAIWVLSSQSTLPHPKGILGFDKVQHCAAYMALSVALGFWFFPERWRRYPLRTLFAVILIASIYGILDEIHQYFVPYRDCNVWDWLADTLGAIVGALAVLGWHRFHRRAEGPADGDSAGKAL